MSCYLPVTVAKAYSDLSLFQKKHDVNPLRGFLVPMVQVSLPIYSDDYISLWGLHSNSLFLALIKSSTSTIR